MRKWLKWRLIVILEVDKQVKELKLKNNAEQEKKRAKYAVLFDKFSKLSEKCAQVEIAKKNYSEKVKDLEKENKDFRKTFFELNQKVELVVKENTELRLQRATKEKFLIDRVKRAEQGRPLLPKEEEETKVDERLRLKRSDNKENDSEEVEWEKYRLKRKIDSSSLQN